MSSSEGARKGGVFAGATEARAGRIALAIVALGTLLRLAVLFVSPLQLYPDEAQYWLWSRDLAFGYFSKPPLVAWLIAATTVMARDAEPFVRLSSPLMHAIAALALFRAARRLYDARAALAACALYLVTPGVALSSFVVSTDAALLACLSLALWAYAALQSAAGRARLTAAAGFGAALGLGFLAKYAVLFSLAGLATHLALSRDARRAWRPGAALAAVAAFAVIAAPNIAWNATHGFATVAHTASNADWHAARLFNPMALLNFLGGQFGVFGPIPFAVLLGGAGLLIWRRRLAGPDLMLLAFALPPLLVVAAQALISRANANWAAAAYAPAVVLVAAWLVRWQARRWLTATLAIQAAACLGFILFVSAPSVADRVGLANSYKRVRGWRELTAVVVERARLEDANGRLSAVAVDDRFFFNEAAYYGRGYFGREGPPLTMWIKGAAPENQAELTAPLTPARGVRVVAASIEGRNTDAMAADFASVKGREIDNISLGRRHRRAATVFLGEGFHPRPR